MRDVDQRVATAAQPARDLEEALPLRQAERCGWLIQDQHRRSPVQRFAHLNKLTLA
jgi:hypothetical protein